MKNKFFLLFLFVAIGAFSITSCSDDDDGGCTATCAAGQIQTVTCGCVTDPASIIPHPCPDLTCPQGQVVGVTGTTCNCVEPMTDVCDGKTCPEGEILDAATCDCVVGQQNEVGNPEADALLATAYQSWLSARYNNQGHLWGLATINADLTMLPTRGTDWFDGGKWVETHQHNWFPEQVSVKEGWEDFLILLTQSIEALAAYESQPDPVRNQIGQAQAMVAHHLYYMFDLYNKVPYDQNNTGDFVILEGMDAFNEAERLYRLAEDNLQLSSPGASGQYTKAAVWGMLAKMYLNKAVYEDRYGTPNFSADDMNTVYELTSNIIESGMYALESDYFRMFDYDNDFNSEFILVVQQFNDSDDRTFGRNEISRVHYERSQFIVPGIRGSNGPCMTPDFFAMWGGETNDPRYFERNLPDGGTIPVGEYNDLNRGILVGPQFGVVENENGDDFVTDGNGNYVVQQLFTGRNPDLEVNFTVEVDDITGGADGLLNQGARIAKFQMDPNGGSNVGGFDIPLIRLSDIYYMRAEATLRGATSGDALADVNAVRTARMGQPESGTEALAPLGAIDLDQLLVERALELYWEPHRRIDVIRFGKWEDPWSNKTDSDPMKRIYPIYGPALSDFASFGLTQNPGY